MSGEDRSKLTSSQPIVGEPMAPQMMGTPMSEPSSHARTMARLVGASMRARASRLPAGKADHGSVSPLPPSSPVPLSRVVESVESEIESDQENCGTSSGTSASPVMVS